MLVNLIFPLKVHGMANSLNLQFCIQTEPSHLSIKLYNRGHCVLLISIADLENQTLVHVHVKNKNVSFIELLSLKCQDMTI